MTSSPLFIRVLESIVIFGPMFQVGCWSACSTPTSARSAAVRPRNGPPLAVRTILDSSRPGCPLERRPWCTAQCSLSTGTSSAPAVDRSGCTTGAPAIRLSLLASARRLPACRVRTVTDRPANPTTPLTTTSAASTRSARSATTSANGRAAATSARRFSCATATTFGRNSLAWAIRTSIEELTPRATTSYRPASARMTSSVCTPIEPDDPAMATRMIGTALLGCPGFEQLQEVVHGRQAEQETVEPIEHTAVAADDRAEVLDVEIALEHALRQIAERGEHGDHDAEDDEVAGAVPCGRAVGETDDDHGEDGGHGSAEQPLDTLVGADPCPKWVLTCGAAENECSHIVGDHSDRQQTQRVGTDAGAEEPVGDGKPGTLGIPQDQRRERTEEPDPHDTERRDGHVGHRRRFEAVRAHERDGTGDESEGNDQRQRPFACPVDGDRRGNAGDDTDDGRRSITLLGDLVEVF